MKQRKLCVHCGKRVANRPRGLCWPCFYCPAVRKLHKPIGKHGRAGARSWEDDADPKGPPLEPTSTLPGTKERIAALRKRHSRRRELWHAQDARRTLE